MIAAAGQLVGARVRIPVPLLMSRRHSANAVAVYALADALARRERTTGRTVYAGREWMAARLGVSVSAVDRALAQLTTEHHGDGLGQAHPAYLTSQQRGHGRTAIRTVHPAVPFVEVPAWTLGDADSGPLVSARAWRLYAALLDQRDADGIYRPAHGGRGELAQLARLRADALPGLLAELADAGMVVTATAAGRATVAAPLAVRVADAEQRAELAAELAQTCGYPPTTPLPIDRATPLPIDRATPLRIDKAYREAHGRDTREETHPAPVPEHTAASAALPGRGHPAVAALRAMLDARAATTGRTAHRRRGTSTAA